MSICFSPHRHGTPPRGWSKSSKASLPVNSLPASRACVASFGEVSSGRTAILYGPSGMQSLQRSSAGISGTRKVPRACNCICLMNLPESPAACCGDLYWEVGRLGAFQDFVHKRRGPAPHGGSARPIRHQTTVLYKSPIPINRWQSVLDRECRELSFTQREEKAGEDEKCTSPLLGCRSQ